MEITISEPVAEKVVDSCMGVDNRRYYKVQWQATWEPEEEIVMKYQNLIEDYWKETESNEIEAGRTFINTLFEKLNESEDANTDAKKEKDKEVSGQQEENENEGSQYDIQSFYKEVNSPEHKIADEPPPEVEDKTNKPPPLWPWRNKPGHGAGEVRPYKCNKCIRSYSTERKLRDHERKLHTNVGTYQCSMCPKIFSNKRNLQNHMNRHTGVGPHQCMGCTKRFMTPQELEHHKRSCNNLVEKDFPCEVCSKRFATKTHLSFHLKIHLPDDEKPFKCQYCPRTFAYNHDCVHHMRLHIGEKPFKCPNCDAAYHRKSYLTEHMFVHTGISKYRCEECLEYFKTQQMLQTHVKNIHILKKKPGDTTKETKSPKKKKSVRYKCHECNREFRFMKEFHFHQALNHKEMLEKQAENKLEFTEFEPTMVYKCKKCEKTFTWPSALKKHSESHRFEEAGKEKNAKTKKKPIKKEALEKTENKENEEIEIDLATVSEAIISEAGEVGNEQEVNNEQEVTDQQQEEIITADGHKIIVLLNTEDGGKSTEEAVEDGSYTCGHCYSTFDNEVSLNVHMLEKHQSHELTEQERSLIQAVAGGKIITLDQNQIVMETDDIRIAEAPDSGEQNVECTEERNDVVAMDGMEISQATAESLLQMNNAEHANLEYIDQL